MAFDYILFVNVHFRNRRLVSRVSTATVPLTYSSLSSLVSHTRLSFLRFLVHRRSEP